MKNLKTFKDYSDLDKQDKERAERNQISNFPHSAKKDAKKREEREKRSRKEDPDGMYPRDDKRYDDSNDSRGGWQDGMGKPSWLGESVEDEDLILSLMKDKGWGDLSYNRIEDFKNSDYYKDPIDENDFVEQFDDYLYSQEDEEFNEEDSNVDLSIELENKLRILGDDSEMTVDDFLEEFEVDLNNMTGFAWAAILNGAEKYKGMSDEEFSKVYDEYKNSK
jgi:hypothetical protein